MSTVHHEHQASGDYVDNGLVTRTHVDCLFSTVRNIAPHPVYFGFLPNGYGKRLDSGESYSFWGNIQDWMNRYTPDQSAVASLLLALYGSVAKGISPVLALVKTPAVHLFDSTTEHTKILTLANSNFVAADPCWGAYLSSSIPHAV